MIFRIVLICFLLLGVAYAGVFLGSIFAQGWALDIWALPFGVLTCGAFLLGCAFFFDQPARYVAVHSLRRRAFLDLPY